MKGSELKRKLRKAGCKKTAEGANHEKWFSSITNQNFWIPRHDSQEIKPATLKSILKAAGIQ